MLKKYGSISADQETPLILIENWELSPCQLCRRWRHRRFLYNNLRLRQ